MLILAVYKSHSKELVVKKKMERKRFIPAVVILPQYKLQIATVGCHCKQGLKATLNLANLMGV